jgi:lipopolysaccharide transport system ATP-binding protein
MSEPTTPAIRLQGVGKLYKLFSRRRDYVLDAAGLGAVLRWRGIQPQIFWALRDIDLEIRPGRRLGIIGRNGAGKSTLLKVITGILTPTEGTVVVNGRVQALFEAGSGFHPEFTGYENIHASLTYQGLDEAAIRAATDDISEFTELGDFLGQPLKAYSLGMQARLAFAVATATRPQILIVDEVLGAGDAYFMSKSTERMRALVEDSGATVVLVSHDSSAILRYCEECVWVERGRIVQRGRTIDVVNAYEGFIHEMDDRRLRAKNRRRASGNGLSGGGDGALRVALRVDGPVGSGSDVAEVALINNGEVQTSLELGRVATSGAVGGPAPVLAGECWSDGRAQDGRAYRTLTVPAGGEAYGSGEVSTGHSGTLGNARLAVRVVYRTPSSTRLSAALVAGERALTPFSPAPWSTEWNELLLDVPSSSEPTSTAAVNGSAKGRPSAPGADGDPLRSGTAGVVRWPSEGSLTFVRAVLLDPQGRERAVFATGTPLRIQLHLKVHRGGRFNLILAASVYRLDGVFIANLISPRTVVEANEGDRIDAAIDVERLPLGNARYVISLSAFEAEVSEHTRYDLVARVLEFEIRGSGPLTMHAVVQLDAAWRVGLAPPKTPGVP